MNELQQKRETVVHGSKNNSDQSAVTEPAYLMRILQRLRTSWRIWMLGFAAVGILGFFLDLAEDVWMKEGFAWDAPFMLAVHELRAPWLDMLMIGVTRIGSPGVYALAPIVAAWLWLRQRRPGAAIALSVSIIGAALLSVSLKLLFARPRPTVFPPLIPELTYSFPSGHALSALAFYGFMAYFLWQQRRQFWAILAFCFALLISLSRIYIGVHYPSDVLGSLSLGLLWVGVVIIGYRYYQAQAVATEKGKSGSQPETVL